MKPPYAITDLILKFVSQISEKIGELNALHLQKPRTELRKTNRIRTIQSSLSIEGNALTMPQVTAIFDNKRVAAPKKDILEVKNAVITYNNIQKFIPANLSSFLKAHKMLMAGLMPSAGRFRTGTVGIVKGSNVAHVAPPGHMVASLMKDLFKYIANDSDLLLIRSCVFHYELEFIHPFADGNGRMGRLWQTVLLMQQYPVFEFLPVESIIKKRQPEYYKALSASDKAGDSTRFIEFMLQVIIEALDELLLVQHRPLSSGERILFFKTVIGKRQFARKDYLHEFKDISPATASRDLKDALDQKIIIKKGDKRMAVYKFK